MKSAVTVIAILLAFALPAQCVVKEIAPMAPAKTVVVDTKDYGVVTNAIAAAIASKNYDAIKDAIAAAIASKNYDAIKDALLLVLKSKDFSMIAAISKTAINRFDVLEGYAKPMSVIDALCHKGRYLESIGADTSKVVEELERIIKQLK